MREVKQAVILAGGMGTRLKPFTDTAPKPMYPIEGKPFIEYLIRQVKDFGINKILLLLGYMPEKIKNYLGDGSQYGLEIVYDITPVEYDTGARILNAKDKIEDIFLLMYCDNYCPVSYEQLVRDFNKNDALLQVSVYKNADLYTKNNMKISADGLVEVYDKKRVTENLQGVDIGYALVDKKVLELMPPVNDNFEKNVYPELVEQKRMYATVTEHRYYSVGSFERIELTKAFFSKRKCIFLDRDGTLNVRPPRACYIERPEDFVWLDGAKEAVKMLKDAGYFIILISNQPGIARGNLTEDTLLQIHEKMQNDLAKIGAGIDRIYYCPHNWDEGCECRKPKPGMFYMAQKEYSIDLTKCYMIGDDERDMEAGQAAGLRCMFVDEKTSLLDCIKTIIEENEKDYEENRI